MKFSRDAALTGGVGDPETTDLDRRTQDVMRFGTVKHVDTSRTPPAYRVLIGDENDDDNHILTDWLPAGGARAKGDTETHYLEEGERVTLLAEGGELATAYVMPAGIYTEENKPATKKAGEWRRRFKNGAVIGYDRETGELTLDATAANGKVTMRGKDAVVRMSGGKMTFQTGDKATSTGPKPDDAGGVVAGVAQAVFDLNRQLKGLHARIEQAEHTISAQHFATSILHNLLLARNPQIAPLLSIFNQAPGGLERMTQAVTALLPGYARSLLAMAVGKFNLPTLESLGDIGNLLGSIVSRLQGEVAAAIAEKLAILGQVASIEGQIAVLRQKLEEQQNGTDGSGSSGDSGGSSPPDYQGQITALEGQITTLMQAEVFTILPELQAQLANLVAAAPVAGDFFGSQGNIVKGMIESVRFGGLGAQD